MILIRNRGRVKNFSFLGTHGLFLEASEVLPSLCFSSTYPMECTNPFLRNTFFQNQNDCIGFIYFIHFENIALKTKIFNVTRSQIGQKLKYRGIFEYFFTFLKAKL